MTVHSPTPFRTDGSLIGYREGEDCPPQSWTLIARIEQGIGNRPACQHDQREANAAFIVAACNAHADLLDALKQAEPILDAASATAREDGGTMIPGARPAWDAVRAAIERITP